MDLSIVIPVFNEEDNILPLVQRLHRTLAPTGLTYEFIFVNDGSRDATLLRIKELSALQPEIRYIDLSRNFGHQIAVSAGLDYATGQVVGIIDADLQDPPELLLPMYDKWKEGYDVVYALRIRRKGESWFKLITARLFYRILAKITHIDIPLDTGDFRIMDKRVVEVLRSMPERHKFLRGQIAWVGFRQTGLEYERDARQHGKSGYPFSKMLRFALDGITGFSDIPLRFVSNLGIVVTIFAFLMTLYALYSRFILQDYTQGWTSIIITVLFMGGVQMISIGIIGEYLTRINADTRKRPLYVVRENNLR
jgi:polyisoprenyl-phosphate glycosyltransferase